ncbi:MAG: patatin-like phospholipase family protein [Burkholderiaceae bacterium]|nr:patatin-like phospholipase family protein [Burkholderiaceae bacterium]
MNPRGGATRRVPARIAWLLAAYALLLAAGCASTIFTSSKAPGDIPAVDPPRFEAQARGAPPRVALVLSGGAARAFAHLGVLRVLEREGLQPDLIVGSSAGAMVGAYYASGKPVREIEALAARLNLPTLIDIDPIKTLLGGFGGLGLAKGERLEAFLRESIGAPLQSLPTRFVAVATDLNTGEPVLLNHGDTPRALRASSAVPGLYEPVHNGERMLGDGQIVSPLPIGAARQLGARVVIGVDVVYPPQNASLTSPLSVLFQTVTISTYRHLLREREQADLAIVPDIPPTADLALSDREWLIAAGEAAAQKVLPALRAAFERR